MVYVVPPPHQRTFNKSPTDWPVYAPLIAFVPGFLNREGCKRQLGGGFSPLK
jgi:hypothetical protein